MTHIKEVYCCCKSRSLSKTPRIARDWCFQQLNGSTGTALPQMVTGLLETGLRKEKWEGYWKLVYGEDKA